MQIPVAFVESATFPTAFSFSFVSFLTSFDILHWYIIICSRNVLVFRPRVRQRKYDQSEFNPLADNYPSAEEAKHIIEQQFREEEKLGWMYPLSEAEARRRFGDKLRIASLAAIQKDETTVRVLFDGTHSVQVNNEIRISDRLEFPSPSELAHVMEHAQRSGYGVVLSIAADIMKAHRRFLHAVEDHGFFGMSG